MGLEHLDIRNVRNLAQVTLEPGNGLNLIVGPNGSGKTSLLEAIFLLGRGRSFRVARITPLIRNGTTSLRVFGRHHTTAMGAVSIGIERGKSGSRIRVNEQDVRSLSVLASHLPLQLITPESHRLLEQGPRHRRQFMDWALFHVEPRFRSVWQAYHRALRQRNAWLRSGAGGRPVWDETLVAAGLTLHQLRAQYLEQLASQLGLYITRLLDVDDITLRYVPGWPAERSMEDALASSLERDRRYGSTQVGPHRADFMLLSGQTSVSGRLSRGQQKLLVAALNLAQAALTTETSGHECVLLVDDLPAELDQERRAALMQCFDDLPGQVFVTSTAADLLPLGGRRSVRWFHVEQGRVTCPD